MRSVGIEDDAEIRKFADPQYWLTYFPPQVKRDLENMGLKVSFYFVSPPQHVFNNRSIGVVHSSLRMPIHSMIHLYDGNFIT